MSVNVRKIAEQDQQRAFIEQHHEQLWMLAAQAYLKAGRGVLVLKRPAPGETRYIALADKLWSTKLPPVAKVLAAGIDPQTQAAVLFLGPDGNAGRCWVVNKDGLEGENG